MCTKVVDKSYLEIADYLAEHPDCGCILFDISHYIEAVNLPPIFDFSFSVNGENCGDFVVNHRFPNHFYWTLSKKNGRRLSKAGYPFYIKLEKFTGELSVQVNAKMAGYHTSYLLHFLAPLTHENPVCGTAIRNDFPNKKLLVTANEPADACWYPHTWEYHQLKNTPYIMDRDNVHLSGEKIGPTILFREQIELFPCRLGRLLVL